MKVEKGRTNLRPSCAGRNRRKTGQQPLDDMLFGMKVGLHSCDNSNPPYQVICSHFCAQTTYRSAVG